MQAKNSSKSQDSLDEGCRYKYNLGLEDEYRCPNPIIPPARRYCDLHSESGPKQNKAITQKKGEYVKNFRQDKRDAYLRQNSNFQFRRLRGLTKPHLTPSLKRYEALHEQYPSSKQPIHEYVFNKLNEMNLSVIEPLNSDLLGTFATIGQEACNVLALLNNHHDAGHNLMTDRLIVYGVEMQRDVGMWMQDCTFTLIEEKAQQVLQMWFERGDLLNLCHGLLVLAELYRQQFYADAKPHRWQLWKQALQWVDAAAFVCRLYKGEQQKTAAFLAFYSHQAVITLLLDARKPQEATNHIHTIQQRANDVADVCGTGLLASLALYFASMQQAQYHMQLEENGLAEQYLIDAQHYSSTMKWRPLSTQQDIAYIEARLALARHDQERQKHLQNYLSTLSWDPGFEQLYNLQELKGLYKDEVPDLSMFKGVRAYVQTFFNYLHPILLTV
jgi:hypothetical protein